VLEAELALVGSAEAGGLRGEITVICKRQSRKVWVGFTSRSTRWPRLESREVVPEAAKEE
jgi:hypothetical protein